MSTECPAPAPTAHASVKFVHAMLKVQERNWAWLIRKTGINKSVMQRCYRGLANPSAHQADAMLAAVGYEVAFQRVTTRQHHRVLDST